MKCYLRFGDLASYLVLQPLKRLQRDAGVSIEFYPLLDSMGDIAGSNVKPGEDDPLADYRARRKAARRKAAIREHERMCECLGMSPENGRRTIDPLALSLGLVWASQLADAQAVWRYVEAAFEKTFLAQADVESFDAVERLLEAEGVTTVRFAEAFMAEAGNLEDEQETLLEKGIFLSPSFDLDGEIFQGREHLPYLRWRLTGSEGSPPV